LRPARLTRYRLQVLRACGNIPRRARLEGPSIAGPPCVNSRAEGTSRENVMPQSPALNLSPASSPSAAPFTRRSLLRLAIGAGVAGLAAACVAPGQVALRSDLAPNLRVSAIQVDVRPLTEQGWGPNAALVRSLLQDELGRAFADRRGSGGATLLVRVSGVSLPAFVGGSGGGSFIPSGGGTTDFMDSEASLIGAGGELLARQQILSAIPSASSGAWFQPGIDQRRLASLARHNAAWTRRQLIGR
jgi:hypothetical protein